MQAKNRPTLEASLLNSGFTLNYFGLSYVIAFWSQDELGFSR